MGYPCDAQGTMHLNTKMATLWKDPGEIALSNSNHPSLTSYINKSIILGQILFSQNENSHLFLSCRVPSLHFSLYAGFWVALERMIFCISSFTIKGNLKATVAKADEIYRHRSTSSVDEVCQIADKLVQDLFMG